MVHGVSGFYVSNPSKIWQSFFENVVKFPSYIQEAVKERLNTENTCYY